MTNEQADAVFRAAHRGMVALGDIAGILAVVDRDDHGSCVRALDSILSLVVDYAAMAEEHVDLGGGAMTPEDRAAARARVALIVYEWDEARCGRPDPERDARFEEAKDQVVRIDLPCALDALDAADAAIRDLMRYRDGKV